MNVYDWAENALKDIFLFNDEVHITSKAGAVITRNVSRERELAIGLINSNSAKDLYDIARQVCPTGTIIEDFDETEWNELYADKSKVIEMHLTKALLNERTGKGAKVLLDILQKRMNNWKDTDKKVEVKTDAGVNVTFSVG